jgi:hypothetical protein
MLSCDCRFQRAFTAWDCFFKVKLRCDERFTHAFTACGCIYKEITLVGSKPQTKVISLKMQLHAVNAG